MRPSPERRDDVCVGNRSFTFFELLNSAISVSSVKAVFGLVSKYIAVPARFALDKHDDQFGGHLPHIGFPISPVCPLHPKIIPRMWLGSSACQQAARSIRCAPVLPVSPSAD